MSTASEGRVILLFASIHDVLAAEALARGQGASFELVPAPRDLSSDCGMVLDIAAVDWERLSVQLTMNTRLIGAYRQTGTGYTAL